MRKLFWFLILVFSIAILSLVLYVIPITQTSVIFFYTTLWGALTGVQNAIATSWLWQVTMPFHAVIFGITGFIMATILAIKVNGWWHKFRLSQIRSAQKQAGFTPGVMPVAPAMAPATVAVTSPVPVEPEKQNQ